jgi:hypothetical protein
MQPPSVGNTLSFVTPTILVGSPPVQINAMSVDSNVLPYIVQGSEGYVRLEVSLYGTLTANSSPVVSGTIATFTGTAAVNLNAGNAVIQFLARNYDPSQIGWNASITRAIGYRFVDDNAHVQMVVAATGATGSVEPTVFTLAGQFQDVSATVTGVSISSNVLTVQAENNFSVGMTVGFNNIQLATFLNGMSVVITSVTSTSFTAIFAASDYSSVQQESGTVGVVTADGGVTWLNIGFYQISPTVQFTIIPFVSGSSAVIGPPSAVNSYKSQIACRVEWLQPTFAGTVGTRVVFSTDPAGVNPPFVQYGDIVPPSQVSRVATQITDSTTTTSLDPTTGLQVITTTNQTQEFTFNYVDIPPSAVAGASPFYVMLSTVVQDPLTNAEFESQQNGPITCGFVNLSLVSPTDFLALQRKEDIAGRLIAYMTQLYPNLDLSPRSEMRDLLIDPVAIELSNMSVREWFARCSTSVSAMSQIDDANGDGISDDFNSSPIKQQIARAFGLNANDTQTLIDNQFNILGENAGLTRAGAAASVVTLTFYNYTKPTQTFSFPLGILCTTTADSVTPALSFITTGSASLTPNSAASFYNPVAGRWEVSIPANCQSTGSSTNAGAGTISTVSSGGPGGWSVTNLVAAAFGQDQEINSHFASRIANKQVTGVDSGTRNGYYTAAQATPGIVATQVVAAGDLEMVRDWDPIRQKHVFGCVDIYCQGTSSSEEDDIVAFQYQNNGTLGLYTSYIPLTIASATGTLLKLQAGSLAFQALDWPLYQGVEIIVTGNTGSFYLNVTNAQFNTATGAIILDPAALSYQVPVTGVGQVRIPYLSNLAAVQAAGGNVTYGLLARLQSPLTDVPTNQPVVGVNDVIGQPTQTGTVPTTLLELIHNSDFLLNGGSNQAGDEVQVASTVSSPITVTLTASTSVPVTIGTAVDIPIDLNGNIGNILSVRSTDLSTLYTFGPGGDYAIVATGPYRTYGLALQQSSATITNISITGGILTVTGKNRFGTAIGGSTLTLNGITNATFLNGQQVSVIASTGNAFTAFFPHADYASAADTGTASGFAIQDGQQVVVSFNQFILYERLSFASNEVQTLNGGVANTLNNNGFVHNTWLPESYGTSYGPSLLNGFSLTLDGAVLNPDGSVNIPASTGLVGAGVPHDSRYIKVLFQTASSPPVYEVMLENVDFVLNVDAVSGTAAIARNLATNATSRIPDGGQVLVSYFYNEAFDVSSEFPSFVPILAAQINKTKHAAADVLIKAMVANPIDITLSVTLNPGVSANTLDSDIRTAIDRVLDTATTTLYQSEVVSQIQNITGVKSVSIPLIKCAKSDGSYDIGFVIPTGTLWTPLDNDPAFSSLAFVTTPTGTISYIPKNSFITTSPILPDSTVPSGGPANVFVGLLYEGQAYSRTFSVQNFLTSAVTPPVSSGNGSFYIIGSNDKIFIPNYNGNNQDYSVVLNSTYPQRVILTIPLDTPTPSLKSYFVTYQVFGESSAKDITLSATEYFVPGRVTINYITTGA